MFTRRQFLQACTSLGAAFVAPGALAGAAAPGLAVRPLAPDVWLHTSWELLANGTPFPSNGLVVLGRRRGLIVDTTWPTEDMERLVKTARGLADGRPLRLVVTHAHDDRMSGVTIARRHGVKSLAHVLTQEDAPKRNLPIADETWKGTHRRLRLGGRAVTLFRPGPAHTRDNIVAFVHDCGLLFGGCMVRAAKAGSLGNVADADVANWAASVASVIAEFGGRVRIVIPGHGDPGGPELLAHTKALAAAAKEKP